jgi:hypothetical protein
MLKSPDNEIFNLFNDTARDYNYSKQNYFKSKGKYSLSIWFQSESNVNDSIEYDFELYGNEIVTEISVTFDYRDDLTKIADLYVSGDKILNGYIRVNKYYTAPPTIEIELGSPYIGGDIYKGPLFKIKNNTKDTLYGEHLPGYFWGSLCYLKNDSIIATEYGTLDLNFVHSPPLYPDSIKYAYVGSFGLTDKLSPLEYRFEVMLAKKWQSKGISLYKELQYFKWWAGTKEYYKLIYGFKIDK